MTGGTAAIYARQGRNDAAEWPVPPQGPPGTSPSSRARDQGNPHRLAEILGRTRRCDPEPDLEANDDHARRRLQLSLTIGDPMWASDRAAPMLTDRGSVCVAIGIVDPAARDSDLSHCLRPYRRDRGSELSLLALEAGTPVSTSPQTTSHQEPVTTPPDCEVTRP
jgi:hypothetical protein